MSWLPFALGTMVLFGIWGVLSKLALEHANWAQVSLGFGVASAVVSLAAMFVLGGDWTSKGVALTTVAGVVGGVGFLLFNIALDRGPASQVVPIIGVYPALTAVLAVLFLSDRLSAVQAGGVALAVTGVLLVGFGGG